jgi:hypothetical protein
VIPNEKTKIQKTGMAPLQKTRGKMEKSQGKNQQNTAIRRPETCYAQHWLQITP